MIEKIMKVAKSGLILIGVILLIAVAWLLVYEKHYITAIFSICVNIFLLEKLADAIDFGD